jgi:ABC-type transport system involved in multi-copper enzyme maturation permease subunit
MNEFRNTTRAELYRMTRWPAVWITLGAWMSLALMFGYVFAYIAYRTGDRSFADEGATQAQLLAGLLPDGSTSVLLQGMPMFGGALMMVLGAITAGNGYSWGTWKTLLTQGPPRGAAVGGSIAAMLSFVVATVVTTFLVYLAVSWAIAVSEGVDGTWPAWPDVVRSLAAGVLVLSMWALVGYFLGTVARGPALSVGLGLVWALVVENLLRGVGTLLGPIEALTHVLPGTAAGSLVGAIIGVGTNGDDTPGVVDAISGGQALVTVLAYAAVLPLLVVMIMRRRDLTG